MNSVFACSVALGSEANGRIQLFPFGRFYPQDGRKEGANGWLLDDTNGEALASAINEAAVQLMVDYEHQTLYVKENGKGNPAAGWIVRAQYLSGKGLFADVQWTEKASAEIKGAVYRYISPLFLADSEGRVVKVLNAALTNRPALHNLAAAYAASQISPSLNSQPKGALMKTLLIKLFALNADASDEEITQKLQALSDAQGEKGLALSAVYAELAKQNEQIVALSAQPVPDPAKFVALSDLQMVQAELNKVKQQMNDRERDGLIEAALSDGRLLPSQKKWAEDLGKTNLTALSEFLATVAPNAGLNSMQSGGNPPENVVALSAAEIATARALGMSEAEFIREHKSDNKQGA